MLHQLVAAVLRGVILEDSEVHAHSVQQGILVTFLRRCIWWYFSPFVQLAVQLYIQKQHIF